MRTVHELTTDELNELREAYFDQLKDIGEEEELNDPEDIPISNVIVHYEGTYFIDEDFFCNENK